MARNDGVDRTTVRNQPRTESNIADAEAHNERQKACYRNEDIVPEHSHLNIHFKTPSGSYQEMFQQMEQNGTISTRGLKQDAVHYGELVFDVNSAYFHNHGGYEYAKAFYAEAYRAAVDIVGGEQYILSAVMHADERNRSLSQELGRDVYHYHLHVVYIPVVQKDILWSKRCKDPALRGTVKERINQISHSKKWRSTRMLDERGKPLYDLEGKPLMENSYSVLQDIFFDHMEDAGYHGFQRGERGSSVEHLSVLQFKTTKEQERLSGLEEKTAAAAETLEALAQEQEQGREAVEKLSQKAADYEQRLEVLAPQIRDVEELVSNVHSTEELLPEPGALETVKHYRQNKVYPLVDKLRQWLLALYRKYLDLKQDYRELWQKFSRVSQERGYYEERANTLSSENHLLRESAQDLSRVRRALGDEAVDNAIDWAKDREMAEALAPQDSKKPVNRTVQDRSDWEAR